ncbi:MAG: hypothetical protein Q4G43_03585 [Mobilicoccus sp.]|nr:hypothetical protein [Mobilicoccus sp.]
MATTLFGGPRGRHAADVVPARRALILAGLLSLGACLTLALGFLQKSHCVRYGWAAPEAYWKACYSDLPTYAAFTGLPGSGLPYGSGDAVTQPVGSGILIWLLSFAAPETGLARQQGFFIAWTILAALCLVVIVCALVWTVPSRPEFAAHVAFSPVLVTVALVSPDLAAIALVSVGLWAWSRSQPVAAGVALGLAMSTRSLSIVVLLVLLGLAVRAGVRHQWARMAGTAVITAVVVIGGATLVYGTTTLASYQVWMTAGAELGSPWYLATLAGRGLSPQVLLVFAVLGWVLAGAVAVWLTFSTHVRPRVGEVALIVVLIILMTGKALPVQAALWVLPFLALARLPWRDHLIWAATEVTAFVAVWLYLGGLHDERAALPPAWYAVFLIVRLLGMSWLVIATIRQIRGRQGIADDEAAGPIAEAPDAVVVMYTRRGENGEATPRAAPDPR